MIKYIQNIVNLLYCNPPQHGKLYIDWTTTVTYCTPHNITFYWLNEAQYGDFYTERQSMVNLPQCEHFCTDWTTAYCKPIIIYLNTDWTTGYCKPITIYLNTEWTTAYCKPTTIYLNTDWTTGYCIYLKKNRLNDRLL